MNFICLLSVWFHTFVDYLFLSSLVCFIVKFFAEPNVFLITYKVLLSLTIIIAIIGPIIILCIYKENSDVFYESDDEEYDGVSTKLIIEGKYSVIDKMKKSRPCHVMLINYPIELAVITLAHYWFFGFDVALIVFISNFSMILYILIVGCIYSSIKLKKKSESLKSINVELGLPRNYDYINHQNNYHEMFESSGFNFYIITDIANYSYYNKINARN